MSFYISVYFGIRSLNSTCKALNRNEKRIFKKNIWWFFNSGFKYYFRLLPFSMEYAQLIGLELVLTVTFICYDKKSRGRGKGGGILIKVWFGGFWHFVCDDLSLTLEKKGLPKGFYYFEKNDTGYLTNNKNHKPCLGQNFEHKGVWNPLCTVGFKHF